MKNVWTEDDMLRESANHYQWNMDDCKVVETRDANDEPCYVVEHIPTGRTTDEAGDAGRWYLDGTAYGD